MDNDSIDREDDNLMKVTIITPTYNSEKFIGETLESIKNQTYSNLEHIICDNMSCDGTKNICSNYNNVFIQQRDDSMYEALNNGIIKSSGDILCFLNSDDYYPDGETIERVVNIFSENESLRVLYGNCKHVDEKKHYLYTRKPKKNITFKFAMKRVFVVPHPALFIRKEIFENYGLYDLNLKLMSDCEYVIRLLRKSVNFMYIDRTVAVFRRHRQNLSLNNAKHEYRYILNKYNSDMIPSLAKIYVLFDNIYNWRYLKYLMRRRLFNAL